MRNVWRTARAKPLIAVLVVGVVVAVVAWIALSGAFASPTK